MKTERDDRREQIATHFDRVGDVEWNRMIASAVMRVSFELHVRMLRRFIEPGARVLEVGAGPGRFTIALAQLGAKEDAPKALAECLRVTKPGGVVLASVMTIGGSMRCSLPIVLEELERFGVDVMARIVRTGDLRPTQPVGHVCRMFRWREVKQMIDRAPCRLLAASASNATSLGSDDVVERIASNPEWWNAFLDWEEELAQEPGALDGGTHVIFAVERSSTAA
jgi:hypothetical protein